MKSLVFDVQERADAYGLPRKDSVRNGVVMIPNEPVWNPDALRRAVAEVSAQAAADTYDQAEIQGHCPNWVAAALNYAALPAPGFAKIGPNGIYELTLKPFAFGQIDPSLNTRFDIREEGDYVYLTWVPTQNADAGAHGFDLTRFDEIKAPELPAGKIVLIAGEMVNPVAVCLALAYAPSAKAVYLRFHQEPQYYCAISNSPDIQIGDTVQTD